MDGIDTKEEYRQNKLLLQKERDGLNASIAQLLQSRSTSAMDEADQTKRILNNIQNVMDILESDSFTMVQKNVALKSIVDKIVFNRDNMHIDIYYYLTEES